MKVGDIREGVAYSTRHGRVQKLRGPAAAHPCISCGKSARHWSHRHGTSEWFSENYDPRCVKCHHEYDDISERGHQKLRGRPQTPEHRRAISEGMRRAGAKPRSEAQKLQLASARERSPLCMKGSTMRVGIYESVEVSAEQRKAISVTLGVKNATRDQLKEFIWKWGEQWPLKVLGDTTPDEDLLGGDNAPADDAELSDLL